MIMKAYTIFAAIALIGITACTKLDKFTQFEMSFDNTVVIPSTSIIDLPFNLVTPDMETNSSSTFAANNTRKDKIEEIILTELKLTLNAPAEEDFSFLKSIVIYINAEGLEEQTVASKEDIPSDVGRELELDVSGIDLQAYIKKDAFSLRVGTVTDEALDEDHEVNVHTVFYVDAKVLGQ